MQFVDSVMENNKVTSWGFSTVLVFLICLIIIMTVVASTMLSWYNKNESVGKVDDTTEQFLERNEAAELQENRVEGDNFNHPVI